MIFNLLRAGKLLALHLGLVAAALANPDDQSDYRVQPGSISLNTTVLRTKPFVPRLIEASPRARVSFRIQQVGSFPGGLATLMPFSFKFTNPTGQIFYRDFAGVNVSRATNSTVLVERDVFPPDDMPFGSFTMSIVIDRNEARIDRNRTNNTAVVSGSLLYLPTYRFQISSVIQPGLLPFYDAGQQFTFEYDLSNVGEDWAFAVPALVPVDLYLTPVRFFSGSVTRQRVLSDPGTRFLGRENVLPDSQTTSSYALPADLDALNYSIAAIPNPDVSVPELVVPNRNDITLSFGAVQVRYVYERPDLFIDFIENVSPLQLRAGQTLNVSGRYGNRSEFPSPETSILSHYLVDSADLRLRYFLGTSQTLPLIAAPVGGKVTRNFSGSFTLPNDIPAGRDYRYLVIIDEPDFIDERIEGDRGISRDLGNIDVFAPSQDYLVRVNPLPLPDLAPDPANRLTTLSTDVGEPGEPLQLSASISNVTARGNRIGAPSGTFDVAFFALALSSPEIPSLRLPIGRATITQPIPDGGTIPISLNTSVPDLPPGQYRVGYSIDPNDEVLERDFASNDALNPATSNLLQILPETPLLPDLVVSKFNLPLPLEAQYDDTLELSFSVENRGNGDAAPSELKISLLATPNDPSSAIFQETFTVPAIDNGKSEEIELTIKVPGPPEEPSSLVGSFDWQIEVGERLAESDETNNRSPLERTSIRLLPQDPDALPIFELSRAFLSPQTAIPGDRINTTLEMVNEGFFTASQVRVDLYLSPSQTFNSKTSTLLTRFPGFNLAGEGGSQLLNRSFTLPDDLSPGQYHIFWVIDPDRAIPRQNEDEPLLAGAPLTVRGLNLRLQILERSDETTTLVLYDAREGRQYALRYGPDLKTLEIDLDTQRTGKRNQPLFFEIPAGTETEPAFFVQAMSLD